MTMRKIKDSDAGKPWAVRAKTGRSPVNLLPVRNIFRIFCEGENTEPLYFKSFPVNTETVVEVIGLGRSKLSLIREVILRLKKERMLGRQEHYDADRQIWVVFDMDYRGLDPDIVDFDEAISLATRHGLRIAWSNDSFELWIVLHCRYLDTALTTEQYYGLISQYFGCDYKREGKRRGFCSGLYQRLLADKAAALKNAKRLYDSWDGVQPSRRNPCTTVFQLVTELNHCLRY